MDSNLIKFLEPFNHFDIEFDTSDFPIEWREPLEQLLCHVSQIDHNQASAILQNSPEILSYRPILTSLYGRYVRQLEIEEVRNKLSMIHPDHHSLLVGMSDFARDSFSRVKDMFEKIDFSNVKELVMVGCGPLPVTILHILEQTDIRQVIGLDRDALAIELNTSLTQAYLEPRFRTLVASGEDYNYAQTKVIYLANLVTSKKKILKRIAQTAPDNTIVILREPFAMGVLFAESGLDGMGDLFKITDEGDGSPRFMSKHVFLKLNK